MKALKKLGYAACHLFLGAMLVSGASCKTSQEVPDEPVAAPGPPAGYSAAVFFPLAVGNSWRYVGNLLGEERDHEVRIVGREAHWFVDSEGERFTVDQEGLRGPTRYLLRAPIRMGEEWTSVVSLSVTEHYEITETGATADVPAGTFYGCVRVIGRVRVNPTVTLFKTDTYCPGVGLVEIKTWLDVAGTGRVPQVEMKLAEYQVAETQ